MNPGNQETGSEWENFIVEPIEDACLLDGANSMPNQYVFLSQPNNMAGTSNRGGNNEDPRDRRRIRDKEYRARCKEDQKRQVEELNVLAAENPHLRDENVSLVKEKETISPKLESAGNKIKQLKSESDKLKRISDSQGILLDAITEKIASGDELQKLNDEVEVARRLRENSIWDPRMLDKKQLLEERLRLENENKLLELQNQAYCMMIRNERQPGEDEDD